MAADDLPSGAEGAYGMILGTPKAWWIMTGVMFLLGLILFAGGIGGTLGAIAGVLLVIGAIVAFAAAPMRYGDKAGKRAPAPTAPAASAAPPRAAASPAPAGPPRPRPNIEAGDASEV